MFEVVIKFSVLGEVPGTESRVDSRGSLVLVGIFMFFWFLSSVNKIISPPKPKHVRYVNLDLITI